jgi:glutathione-independent formaldehyde dehydrogenase
VLLKYNRQAARPPIAEIVNVKVIDIEQAPEASKSFDARVANKYVVDPHGQLARAA